MAPQSKKEEFLTAWRALAGNSTTEGWRTITVTHGGPCHLLAGRHFPGNEEALLVGFTSIRLPLADQLPQGQGFVVSNAVLGEGGANRGWIALRRQNAGSLDLFAMMADDVASVLEECHGASDENLLHIFLARIKAWQDFMRRGGDSVLGPEAEVGLFGELETLRDIISAGVPAAVAIEAWQGPLDGVQDFMFGAGALEVKSTTSPSGFPATIGSLDQLDDSLIRPIFLVGVRLTVITSGKNLPELVGELRDMLREDPTALEVLNGRLLHAGFLDAVAERYTRRFSRAVGKVLNVSDGFPRLTRANVAIEIRRVRYEIDLDLVSIRDEGIKQALRTLGVIQ